jgi:hypothetical protein
VLDVRHAPIATEFCVTKKYRYVPLSGVKLDAPFGYVQLICLRTAESMTHCGLIGAVLYAKDLDRLVESYSSAAGIEPQAIEKGFAILWGPDLHNSSFYAFQSASQTRLTSPRPRNLAKIHPSSSYSVAVACPFAHPRSGMPTASRHPFRSRIYSIDRSQPSGVRQPR